MNSRILDHTIKDQKGRTTATTTRMRRQQRDVEDASPMANGDTDVCSDDGRPTVLLPNKAAVEPYRVVAKTKHGRGTTTKNGTIKRRKEQKWIRYTRFLPVVLLLVLSVTAVSCFLSAMFLPSPLPAASSASSGHAGGASRRSLGHRTPATNVIAKNQHYSIVFLTSSLPATTLRSPAAAAAAAAAAAPGSLTTTRQRRRTSFHVPSDSSAIMNERRGKANFGGLELKLLGLSRGRHDQPPPPRIIHYDPRDDLTYKQLVLFQDGERVDDFDGYYAFDDDDKRNPMNAYDDDDEEQRTKCRRTSWHRDLPINCNNLHEFDVQHRFRIGDTRFIAEGAYREVYLSELPMAETVAFKAYYWGSDFSYSDFENMRMDALVSEKLTYSDRIVDIYGYCGTGMINEAMVHGDVENEVSPLGHRYTYVLPEERKHEMVVKNQLSGTQKLQYALEMAEAVADLHGFSDGVIVHDDIKIAQFLLSDNGHIKLNDFNRAEVMLYSEEKQQYCRYVNGAANGYWRSPEEYGDSPLNEQIDTYSLGNNLYSLLTGLKPHYEVESEKRFKKKIRKGERGFIDPRFKTRSFGDRKLTEIIPLCWKSDTEERIDVFELVRLLREAVEEEKRNQRKPVTN